MLLDVEHRFAFEYDAYISESFMELRLQPKTTSDQTVSSFVLAVGPPTRVHRYVDWQDNVTHHFTITRFHDRIEVSSRSLVDTHPTVPPIASLADGVPPRDLPYPLLDFLTFDGPVPLTPALRAAHKVAAPPRDTPLGPLVQALGHHLASRFEYQRDVTKYDSTTEDFLRIGAGVCQDFAHLMLGLLRLSQVPCRYVSGYLHVERKGREPSQSHAWIEFWAPSHGWVPFDPTHERAIDERYVVVGHGRHYDDVAPNKGIFRGAARETLRAEVRTVVSAAKPLSQLATETRPIPLETFREPPTRRAERAVSPLEDEQQQQQQQ
ncbi:MAG: transglutaminase family protein [Candidatus Rokuibacteriota bacterium]|nr:MAG: transglutaminase family protein [Candidatus Rokubacteria bacterium]